MNKIYTALQDFGDVKIGETVDTSTWTEEQINQRLAEGILEVNEVFEGSGTITSEGETIVDAEPVVDDIESSESVV